MDKDIIILGAILFITILISICIHFEKSKFFHIVNHPEMIQEMDKIPLWLKIRVWLEYGRYVGNHVNGEELRIREHLVHFCWALDAMKYGYYVKYTEEAQEYIKSLTNTYRMIWMKILSSKKCSK